jgi:CO/xanthine dehydrogenase Mo-binding subunit
MSISHVDRMSADEGHGDTPPIPLSNALPSWDAGQKFQIVGHEYSRLEGLEKVTGKAQYAYDVRLPGQLYAKVLRSPHAHARITRIDASRAAKLPGVHAVITSEDAPEIGFYERTMLFDRTVRYQGDEVAAVAAETEDMANDALRLIEVDYETLPFVTDLQAALQPDAPKVRDEGNLAGEPKVYDRGNVAAGFEEADETYEQIFTTQVALHNCLEPHGCTATWEGEQLTIWESTQSVFTVRAQVAEKLGLLEHHVRVIKQHMGGGFGSKQIAWKQTVIAALLSKRAGRPVQLMLDREAENLAAGNRNPTHQRVRIAAKRDGTLTAIDARIHQAVGAYMVGGEGSNTAGIYQDLYRCPNVHTEQTGVFINAGPAVAFRAPGYVEGAFALETAMDELAHRLNVDPLDLRIKNYSGEDQTEGKPYTLPEGLRYCYDKAAEAFGWRDYVRPPANGAKRRGVGLAAHSWMAGTGHPPGYAWIKLNADGSADVVTGTQDIGTGTRTSLAQVAAEELGMPLDQVAFHLGDTAHGPYAPVSSGSATQATIGPAIRAAAADAKRQLLEAASRFLEEPVERLSMSGGKIRVEGEPEDRATPIGAVTGSIAPEMITGLGARGRNPEDKTIRTFGAQCVEVEVDVETGEVAVIRVAASHDCGRIINPKLVDSQVIGGVTQGIGFALTEERIIDGASGIVLNANLEEYKVPTVSDVPPIEHAQAGVPDPGANVTGAKGVGEPPLIPTAPAIANAIFDAVGVRLRDLPLSRSRLLAAIHAESQEAEAGA